MRLLISFLGACALALPCLAAERIPGTQVTVTPPEGFTPSADFAGYIHEETGASIMVTEIPGPYADVTKGMTAEAMKKQGIELVSNEDVKVGGVEGRLLHTSQAAHGAVYHKWLLIFGNQKTVMIHGTAPKQEFEKNSDALRATLLAAKWEPELKVGMLEGLPFTVEEAGDMKFAFKMGTNLVLTRDGIHPQPEAEKPLVVVNVAYDLAFKADADQKVYAEALLQQTAKLPGKIEILESRAAEMGGKPAYYVSTSAQPKDAKEPIHFETTVLVEDGRLSMVFARCSAASKDEYRPVFEAVCKSFKPKS